MTALRRRFGRPCGLQQSHLPWPRPRCLQRRKGPSWQRLWQQALNVNKVYEMLDGQRRLAEVDKTPPEQAVGFRGPTGPFTGIPVTDLSGTSAKELQRALLSLVEPFRVPITEPAHLRNKAVTTWSLFPGHVYRRTGLGHLAFKSSVRVAFRGTPCRLDQHRRRSPRTAQCLTGGAS